MHDTEISAESNEDVTDDKDARIAQLEHQLDEAHNSIKSLTDDVKILNDELYREKCINNKLLGIPPPFSPIDNPNSPYSSPLITPAQRRSRQRSSQNVLDSDDAKSPTHPEAVSTLSQPPGDFAENSQTSLQNYEQNGTSQFNSEDYHRTSKSLAPLHPIDAGPSKNLSYILNALKGLPRHKSTLLFGDSNLHCVQGELDPQRKNVAIRSVSGLCVVSAAHALSQYNFNYGQISKVVWMLGVNDYLHRQDHCEEDWSEHLCTLINETKRIFKNASIHFVLPFKGLPSVPLQHSKDISDLLMNSFPSVRRHYPPSMEDNVKPDGIHLNKNGAKLLRDFLVSRFTKYRSNPNQTDSSNGPKEMSSANGNVGSATSQTAPEYQHMNNDHLSGRPQPYHPNYRDMCFAPPPNMRDNPAIPPRNGGPQYLPSYPPQDFIYGRSINPIKEMTDALASMLYMTMNR